ncbi:hypothetical protein [Kitasatospora sp. CB01950]|uniref:hypothetical protein n=1 Tax=Kitasatospora sp. CB01950 TaxID=1703930 RepID=UPI0011613967|nr:hypothetical protein [Kitasatospora sp. CB01950]
MLRDLLVASVGLPYWPARSGAPGRRPVAVVADIAGLALAIPYWPARAAAGAVYLLAVVRLWRLARRGSAHTRQAAADLLVLLAPAAVAALTAAHLIPLLVQLLSY